MAHPDLIDQAQNTYQQLADLDRDTLLSSPGNLKPWNGLSFEDFVNAYSDLQETLDSIFENRALDGCPFNIINNLNKNLSTTLQHCQQFISDRNQQHFENAFQHVENMRTGINNWGLQYRAALGSRIQERMKLLDQTIDRALSKQKDIDSLKSNVESLIEPAVAGSLSKAFSTRQSELHSNQGRWYWASVVTALLSITATVIVVWSIVGFFDSARPTTATGADGIIWSTIFLRLGVLVPIFSIFGFTFFQYRKERDLEEDYAHKSAVASSLPNYGNLAVDDQVKDQILSEASKVIFTSPTQPVDDLTPKNAIDIGQFTKLINSLGKLNRASPASE